jgi:hypothetical protein
MQRLIAFFFSVVLTSSLAAAEPSASEKQAFKLVISNQLQAFQSGDSPTAYSYAAPNITKIFPTAEIFMSMVKRGYEPILKNSTHIFGAIENDPQNRPAQHVLLTTTEGNRYEAIYFMELQPDGTWKIAGVQLVLLQGLDA